MKLLFTSLSLLISTLVFADSRQCLQNASNDELVREVAYRLGGHSGLSGTFTASFSCGGNAEIIINSTNLETGSNATLNLATGSWDTCRRVTDLLNSKIGNKTLLSGKIFALCGGNAEITRVLVNASGVKTLSVTATGSWDTCRKDSDQINQTLTP